jgi:hypothetical protein
MLLLCCCPATMILGGASKSIATSLFMPQPLEFGAHHGAPASWLCCCVEAGAVNEGVSLNH